MRQASARRLVRRPSIEALKFRPTVFAFEDRTLPGQAMGLFESFVLGGALATPGLLGQKQSRISAGEAKVSEIAITSKKQRPAKTEGSASTFLAAAQGTSTSTSKAERNDPQYELRSIPNHVQEVGFQTFSKELAGDPLAGLEAAALGAMTSAPKSATTVTGSSTTNGGQGELPAGGGKSSSTGSSAGTPADLTTQPNARSAASDSLPPTSALTSEGSAGGGKQKQGDAGSSNPSNPGTQGGGKTTSSILVTGADADTMPRVKVINAATGNVKLNFMAYADSYRGGVRVATTDVTGDGVTDIITGQGQTGCRVKVFDGNTGTKLRAFDAYAPGETSGVFVAAGDVTGDGRGDIITGTNDGAAPLVSIFDGPTGKFITSFTVESFNSTSGVRVAAGDVNDDGKADIITAAGTGDLPRVCVYDGGNGAELYNFFAFDATFRGGVYVTSGDVTNDGKADIIASSGPGTDSLIRVFSGANTASLASVRPFETGFRDGGKVAVVDADKDGYLDIVAASGSAKNEARIFDGRTMQPKSTMKPYGTDFNFGMFVAGDARSQGQVTTFSGGTVTITGVTQTVTEGSSSQVVVTLNRTITTGPLTPNFTFGGTATGDSDYDTAFLAPVFFNGQATGTLTLDLIDDALFEGPESLTVTIAAGSDYTVGNPSTASVTIIDDDGPPPIAPGSPDDGGLIDSMPGSGGNEPPNDMPNTGTRFYGGAVSTSASDLVSAGFGTPWGQIWGWTNALGSATNSFLGNGVAVSELPYLKQDSAGTVAGIMGSAAVLFWDPSGGNYIPRHYQKEQLSYSSGDAEFTLTDTAGNVLKFYDFDGSLPANKKGQLKSFSDPKGNVTSVTSFTSSGSPEEVQRSVTISSVTTIESYLYTYLTSGGNSGKLSNVKLRRQVGGGSWTTIRQVDYTYYDGSESHGNLGDLKKAVIKDGSGATIDTSYMRYYTSGESNGYVGGLKYLFSALSYGRLAADFADPTTATNAQVAPYADLYMEYDSTRQVTRQTVQGVGCSACTGGLGTYDYAYATSTFPDGYNSWRRKTTATLPDGNERIVYTNYAGQVMLDITKDTTTSNKWIMYYKYDSSGRLVLHASPSAISGYDDAYSDLVHNQSGNYEFLRDSAGVVSTMSYYTSTTAGESTAGGVAGYLNQLGLQRGETATSILQNTTQYFQHTGGGATVNPVATSTVYRNTDGTGGQTTSYSYTWFSSSTRMESMTVSLPVISSTQNGPGTADTGTTYFDGYGYPIWRKDGDGFLRYTAFDTVTGAVTKSIVDVQTTQTSDFANLPSGWSTPSGGGLHLITTMEVDGLARTTKLTDPNGNITYAVYKDTDHEIRVYAGWNTSTNAPTGPTQVYREDRPGSYIESLTMSVTPSVTDGKPTGIESISSVQRLARTQISDGGQVTDRDAYFNLSGLTYSTSVSLGTENTHFYRTRYAYNKRGMENRVELPTNTIYRTEYDILNRPMSSWVGLDDTPTSGSWSPTNTAGTDLVKTSENEYDSAGVGDSNLTKVTQIPAGSASNRVSQFYFDWRNRQVAGKQGVETTESTSLNRPIFYTEFDNLSESIASEQYDGDTVSISDSNSDGVPDKPSSSLLRARSTSSFDDQGRVYKTQVFSVNQSSGAVSTDSLTTNIWFDHRGQVIKQSAPGGMVSKTQYDGAARVSKQFSTDGGSDSAWSDADDVTSDKVVTQTEMQYDANGNTILSITKDRFHDETGTGELGDASTAPKARVSYVASYYDKANRTTDTVNVGTNAGSAYTRPGSVPSRSDTVLVFSHAYNAAGWVETTTDPRAILGKTFYDNLGRTTKTVEAYVDGTPSDTDDKTTEYTYDGNNRMLTLKAYLTSGYQKTEWVYAVRISDGSDINCNDCLSAMKYPDKSSGDPSSSEKESYTVSALHEQKTKQDRNGSVHTYTRDVLGRTTADAVTTLGSGVDGTVRRLEFNFDTAGRPYQFTSYDASSGGNVVNQVQGEYNGLGQLITEYQAHSGAVNTGSTPKVQYVYTEMASSANHSRLTKMIYPNGRTVHIGYDSGLDASISRLSFLADDNGSGGVGTHLEDLAYLGLSTVVKRAHPQPGVDLTYIKQSGESNGDAGDQYTGLDRFNRIVDQRWIKTSDGSHTDRFQYGYDRNGNRLYEKNVVDATFSELYHVNGASAGYDSLNQLSEFRRGTLSDANSDGVPDTVTTATRSQAWDFDALGNFDVQTTDGSNQTRGHNKQNQLTSIQSLTTPTYDANGNMTGDENGKTLVYDPWNRFVAYKNGSTTLVSNAHDALGRRIIENPGTQTDLYYSAGWQVVEEREGTLVRSQNVWSPVYIDAMVLRDRDADGNGSLEERLYAQQDGNWSVSAIVSTAGVVLERAVLDSYGKPTFLAPDWTTRSSSSYSWVYLHQGGRFQLTTGLYQFRYREYSATLGRWVQVDPIGYKARDNNLYRFQSSNPITGRDPFGLLDTTGASETSLAFGCGCTTGAATPRTKPKPKPRVTKWGQGLSEPLLEKPRPPGYNPNPPLEKPKPKPRVTKWGQGLSEPLLEKPRPPGYDPNPPLEKPRPKPKWTKPSPLPPYPPLEAGPFKCCIYHCVSGAFNWVVEVNIQRDRICAEGFTVELLPPFGKVTCELQRVLPGPCPSEN